MQLNGILSVPFNKPICISVFSCYQGTVTEDVSVDQLPIINSTY